MKVLLACSSGGHFATMRGLKPFWCLHERVWVTDRKKDTESLRDEKTYWLPYQAPRDIVALLQNLPATLRILWVEKPDVVVLTGASIAINFAFAARLLGARVIYVESISRFKDLSLSGRIVYPIANEFYVQWPQLCQRYAKAVFRGYAS
jgi:UDP-N-acetylglucosamine:LPS N-acetylglucosamine transferase